MTCPCNASSIAILTILFLLLPLYFMEKSTASVHVTEKERIYCNSSHLLGMWSATSATSLESFAIFPSFSFDVLFLTFYLFLSCIQVSLWQSFSLIHQTFTLALSLSNAYYHLPPPRNSPFSHTHQLVYFSLFPFPFHVCLITRRMQ